MCFEFFMIGHHFAVGFISKNKGGVMFKVSMFFFLLALVSYVLGYLGFAYFNMEIGKISLVLFLFGAIITFALSLTSDDSHVGSKKN